MRQPTTIALMQEPRKTKRHRLLILQQFVKSEKLER